MIEFVHDIAFNMQEEIPNDVVVTDFIKTFDNVVQNRLLYKLSLYRSRETHLAGYVHFLLVDLKELSLKEIPLPLSVLSGVP